MTRPLIPATGPNRILVADDEENTRSAIVRALELRGYQAVGAADGLEVLECLSSGRWDLLLLDLRMPGLDGVQVLNQIRDRSDAPPVIVLTAHASIESAIAAVKAGADDYLLKPQHIYEIINAIERTLEKRESRRKRDDLVNLITSAVQGLDQAPVVDTERANPGPARLVQQAPLLLDSDHLQVTRQLPGAAGPVTIHLTENQAAVLACLMGSPNRVFSDQELARTALDYENISQREAEAIIRPTILRLRRKIETDPVRPRIIRTIRGRGYCYDPKLDDS